MICGDMNPWDSSIHCWLEFGHKDLHRSESQGWADFCHFPGDDCPTRHNEEVVDVSG